MKPLLDYGELNLPTVAAIMAHTIVDFVEAPTRAYLILHERSGEQARLGSSKATSRRLLRRIVGCIPPMTVMARMPVTA